MRPESEVTCECVQRFEGKSLIEETWVVRDNCQWKLTKSKHMSRACFDRVPQTRSFVCECVSEGCRCLHGSRVNLR